MSDDDPKDGFIYKPFMKNKCKNYGRDKDEGRDDISSESWLKKNMVETTTIVNTSVTKKKFPFFNWT